MIDQIARTSAEQLRSGTTQDVDAGLADLHLRHARHRRRTRAGAMAAVALALGLGWGAGSVFTRTHDAGAPGPTHRAPARDGGLACDWPRVHCLGGRTYRFDLTKPVTWHIPPDFAVNSGAGAGPLMVESYHDGEPVAGVTVMERVRASTPTGLSPAHGVADTPRDLVEWVADRPFLDAGRLVRTRVDGRQAWQVRVTLARGAGPGEGLCNGNACHPITRQPNGAITGIWGDMAAEYTAFRVPGAGTTVVWSWIFSGDTGDLADLHSATSGLTWRAD
jgi:hypothetical protein